MKYKIVLFTLITTLMATNAFATKETFSGTLCESLYDNTWPYGNVAYQYGSIWNRSTTDWSYVDCPVPRANGYSSGTIADLEVSVTDTNGGMWCQVINRDRFGATIASETVTSTGTGNQILDFGSVAGSVYEGHITVFCVIPKNSGKVNSIVVDINE